MLTFHLLAGILVDHSKIAIFDLALIIDLMNNRFHDIFFQLLQIGLWQKGLLITDQELSSKEWTVIYQLASTHTVEGIIYDSFSFLKESQLPPQSLRLQWAVRIDQIERYNARMNDVIANQYEVFTKEGIHPILQKGQGVATCYIKPKHRISGDIDWYFPNKDYKAVRKLLKQQKITFKDTAGFSLDYIWKGVPVEHHKMLFDIRSPLKYKYLRSLEKEYQDKQQNLLINGIAIKLLAPELQLLQVTSHILKHMISFGIGFRQICDVARLYTTYKDKINGILLYEMYKKAGILKWIHVLHHLLEEKLGLQKEELPFNYPLETHSNWMLTEIWHGGNFGYHDDRFSDGKINRKISVHPDADKRLWGNFKRYLPYAPQEAIFFPIIHLYSKFLGIDRD
ncbi:nucleotidyltransferase family protein [Sphingobacterium anhuiense]|uniref:nucleotidyltransferase family protein n=1 Tax=Sphingobacterium anhuiense TaxID=493780 RepID=UPI003C2E5E62